MKYVYVLEKEAKFRKEIHEALNKIDPKMQIRYFKELETFAKWVTLMVTDGNKALAQGGVPYLESKEPMASNDDDQLALVISSDEMMGSKSMNLLKKTYQLFARKGLCTAEAPTAMVITAFDDPDFDISLTEEPVISNVIFKPFDLMILQQHLTNAVNGRHPPEQNNLHNMKMKASIEMLKNIKMEVISQVGFVTFSDKPIEVGTISKYYAKEFVSGKTRSVMAKCVRCEPHPLIKEQFQVTLNFFALETDQIKDLRKTVATLKAENLASHNWNNAPIRPNPNGLNMVVLDEKKQNLGESLLRNFVGAKVVEYSSWEQFYADYNPATHPSVTQKNLPQETGFKLNFDNPGHVVIGSEPALKEGDKIFGLSIEQLKKIDFGGCIAPESKADWQSILRATDPMIHPQTICFEIQNQKKFVKVTQKEKVQTSDGVSCLQIGLNELTTEEKINYLKSVSRWPKTVNIVLLTQEFHRKLAENECKLEGKSFLLSNRTLTDAEERTYGATVEDIFVAPYDRNYLAGKIKLFMGLSLPEHTTTYKRGSVAQVANPVEVTEISEGGVILKYSRGMTLGSFRKFILWSPSETDLLEYTGSCNYVEAVEGEDPHSLNHFIFFGMRDMFLKNIRLWIRENYINSKEKTG
ncbi:MAG: hypothetical protein AABY64_11515 [Bdellovibrionota bacterium]